MRICSYKVIFLIFILFFTVMFFAGCEGDDSNSDGESSSDDDDLTGICNDDDNVLNDDNHNDDDDDNGDDDDTIDPDDIVLSVTVADPPEGNPLCRKIVVVTKEPVSLTGFVVTKDEPGYSPSVPLFSEEGTEHEFWFYGLLEEREFAYWISINSKNGPTVAAGCFDVPLVGDPKPVVEGLITDTGTTFTDWYMVFHQFGWSGDRYRSLYIFDRLGRLRFWHPDSTGYLTMTQVMSNGDLVSNRYSEIIGLQPDGSQYQLFDIQLNQPYFRASHHKPYIPDWDTDYAVLIYAEQGPGLECDLVTPTDNMIGDGMVEIDQNGLEVWRWSIFDHLDEIPQDAMGQGICQTHFWGSSYFDWTHANAVMPVPGDNAYMISLRNIDRVVKVDRGTGDIIWQMGEGLDFEWVGNEPESDKWFHMQHDPKFHPGNRFIIYDNGVWHGSWSRALELDVDQDNMTVSLLWEYRVPYHQSEGNIELHENGNLLIASGSSHLITELPPGGGVGDEIFQMTIREGIVRAEYYPSMWIYEDPMVK